MPGWTGQVIPNYGFAREDRGGRADQERWTNIGRGAGQLHENVARINTEAARMNAEDTRKADIAGVTAKQIMAHVGLLNAQTQNETEGIPITKANASMATATAARYPEFMNYKAEANRLSNANEERLIYGPDYEAAMERKKKALAMANSDGANPYISGWAPPGAPTNTSAIAAPPVKYDAPTSTFSNTGSEGRVPYAQATKRLFDTRPSIPLDELLKDFLKIPDKRVDRALFPKRNPSTGSYGATDYFGGSVSGSW